MIIPAIASSVLMISMIFFLKIQRKPVVSRCIKLYKKAENRYLTNMKGKAQIHRSLQTGTPKTNFEKLVSVIRGLKPDEIKTARNYISFGHQENFKGAPALLFMYLLASPQASLADATAYLGGISKYSFDTIVIRLKEKLNYCLISEFNTMREAAYSDKYRAYFQGKDYLKMVHILMRRGAIQEGYAKILSTIELSEKYEWYDSLIEALYLQLEYYSKVSEYGTVEEIENKITYYEYCRRAVRKAKTHYDELMNTNKVSTEGNPLQLYIKTIEHIDDLYQKTKSDQINYQLLKIQINYYLQQTDYVTAERKSQELLSHVSNAVSVKQPLTIGIASLHIAECLMMQQRYNEAIAYIYSSRVNFSKNSINFGETLELEYYCTLYKGEPEKAESIITELLDQSHYPVTLYHRNRRKYLLVCALFAQEKYDAAYDLLKDIGYLNRDKAGWNIGIRILNILLVKLNNDVVATEYILAQWQRELSSIKKHSSIRSRDLELLKLLKKLSRSSDSWAGFYKTEKEQLELIEKSPALNWKPASHEIIDTLLWLKSKALNKSYTYLLAKNGAVKTNVFI